MTWLCWLFHGRNWARLWDEWFCPYCLKTYRPASPPPSAGEGSGS